jgi:glucose-6-phosphate 1-dehydrogenase
MVDSSMIPQSPFVFVLFGATGDLARHKLFPALLSLFKNSQFAEEFYIVGFSRREMTDDAFRKFVRGELKTDDERLTNFLQHVHYQQGTFDDDTGYTELIGRLKGFDDALGACITRLFYLATPPDNYLMILEKLSTTKLSEGCGQGSAKWTRIAIEKPFGKDLETAKEIDDKLAEVFDEKQIFRVDHYLGKETVQNMLAFRFANSIFDPVWNKEHVDHVQITFGEQKGIDGRGKFFDGVGILRDVAQNHLMQLVAAVAMEQPRSFTKEDVRDARTKAIQSMQCIEPGNVGTAVVRGQYAGYVEEKDVDPTSDTETFVAMKFFLDSPRFQNVPFYVRAGKKMPKNVVEISIVFIQTCHILFKEFGCPEIGNILTIRIQPDEGISMRVITKTPGTKLALEPIQMKFSYADHADHKIGDAYEKILLDIIHGDQMLFNRSDELQSSWTFITNIMKGWEETNAPVLAYNENEWGPKEANELIERDGRHWL